MLSCQCSNFPFTFIRRLDNYLSVKQNWTISRFVRVILAQGPCKKKKKKTRTAGENAQMEIEVLKSVDRKPPSDRSDEERATKKFRNRNEGSFGNGHGASFKDTLMGNSDQGDDGVINMADNFVLEDADVKHFHDDGVPAIAFADRVQQLMAESMKNSVIIKLLGKSIGYGALWTKIHSLWNSLGEIKIVDLEMIFSLSN